ncbi:MAG TPA: alkaline phosphatase family protein [Anaerolineales bacterium]
MSKLLIIGIDALDAVQLDLFQNHLPNLSRLRKLGFYSQLESVWPPDSETAWASIYTGWNPARHGIFQFVDPLQKTCTYLSGERDNAAIRGQAFWDLAGSAGRKVCVLFPHIGFPAWPVNGVMVTRASTTTDISVSPPELMKRYNFDGLNAVKGLVGRNRRAYLHRMKNLVERQLELNLQLIKEQEWDLFFSYWPALDIVQHQFWAHCDPADPTFWGDTPYRYAIRDFYVLHDWVVAELIKAVGPGTNILILSDHGHGMRPVKIFNVNRLLRERGLLAVHHPKIVRNLPSIKKMKDLAAHLAGRYQLGRLASGLVKLIPWTRKAYISAAGLDLENTVACITDMSGIKAYSYGGIQITQNNLNGRLYEALRDEIIELLQDARDPEIGDEPILKWAKRREDLYSGPYLAGYPDIVFELRNEYGAGWDATGPLFDVSHTHNLYPGSHIASNAIFLLLGPAVPRIHHAPASLLDIAPTVLDILNVPAVECMDESSILSKESLRKPTVCVLD